MNDGASELALLRRFEPVLRFTRGEQFFPMKVEPYVRAASLWVQRPDEAPQRLVAAGQLDLERLAYPYPDEFGAVHYLKLLEPNDPFQVIAYPAMVESQAPIPMERFQAGRGRLARVGYGSRLIDALFSISLLARGRVPGDAAKSAAHAYRRMMAADSHYSYYGRVLRENGWVVLQYWFFYLFNNWRSSFFGANDHEADWEMVMIFLSQDENSGGVQPQWVAYAAHDGWGDDLRRRWEDPEVEKVGEHPVVYIGAGSHASYFRPGEYLTEIELPFLSPLVRFVDGVQRLWRRRLRQYAGDNPTEEAAEFSNIFRIPFVDYARGDGLTLGPEQATAWSEPQLLNPTPPWVSQYRGLWGLFTHDPFAGEDAPAGPMFNRDGSVRRAWYDPVGWAGLDKVPPPDEALAQVAAEQAAIRAQQSQMQEEIDQKARQLQGLGTRAAAIRTQPHLYRLSLDYDRQVEELSQTVDRLRGQLAAAGALLEALTFYAERLRAGDAGPLRAHLRRSHAPASDARLRFNRLAEVWAAISIGLMLVIFVGLVVFARRYLVFGLLTSLALFALIEAGFRGSLVRLVTGLTVTLSLIAALVIVYEFFWQLAILGVLIAGGYILWENLRELGE